jgi:hypothetical protein
VYHSPPLCRFFEKLPLPLPDDVEKGVRVAVHHGLVPSVRT